MGKKFGQKNIVQKVNLKIIGQKENWLKEMQVKKKIGQRKFWSKNFQFKTFLSKKDFGR